MVMVHSVAITLLRHGLTEANERKEYLGWTDSPLSERGRMEISKLKAGFRAYELIIRVIYIAVWIHSRLLFPEVPIHTNPAFREMNWGCFEGKTYEQLKEEISYQKWLNNPMEVSVPEGESYPIFSERVE